MHVISIPKYIGANAAYSSDIALLVVVSFNRCAFISLSCFSFAATGISPVETFLLGWHKHIYVRKQATAKKNISDRHLEHPPSRHHP